MPDPVTLASTSRYFRDRRPLRWSLDNWRKGFQLRPVRRCRRCDHTTPNHYPTCIEAQGHTDA